ncbi:helix-turn-helix domain-containing protein [Paracoccus sp. NBH48]|uniref:helix-turn-helix domain-containing protein n=1 Tax=Paracoccus sp. NBH48 TaxID=2596918 RepID=UPI00351C2FB3
MADPTRKRGRPRKTLPDAPGTVQSLDRALDLLDLLAAHPGLTLSEVADRSAQPPSDRAPGAAHAGRARHGRKRPRDAGLEHRAAGVPPGVGLHAPVGPCGTRPPDHARADGTYRRDREPGYPAGRQRAVPVPGRDVRDDPRVSSPPAPGRPCTHRGSARRCWRSGPTASRHWVPWRGSPTPR